MRISRSCDWIKCVTGTPAFKIPPDVDLIHGLSPAISIKQKTTSRNPRSTVGTVTEIYDSMRLLWARASTLLAAAGLVIEARR
jgi:excinuclease UvrABC ATPase subunit